MKLLSMTFEQEETQFVSSFPSRASEPEYYDALDLAVQQFLTFLETVEGPSLWYSRTESLFSFYARDSQHENDLVPPLVFVKISGFNSYHFNSSPVFYRIEYPLPREARPWVPASAEIVEEGAQTVPRDVIPRVKRRHGNNNLWASAWVTLTASGEEMAATQLLNAIAASDTNPSRTRAHWMWYLCPVCDLHSPHYMVHCERCRFSFPPENEMKSKGLYLTVSAPEGIIAPETD